MSWSIHHADCLEHLAQVEEASIEAIVTDPPYGIRFMGQAWDGADIEDAARTRSGQAQPRHKDGSVRENPRLSRAEEAGRYDLSITANQAFQAWSEAWATEGLRVLKPGGHLLAFGGSRTYHRLACAVEDAGFEIRDSLLWLYGSGFPKSLDVSKAIDKAAGVERDAAPATPEAAQWEGWGTALKPAHEPIIVARKPFAGTVAANVQKHGTGALNVDGCRIDFAGETDRWKPEHHRQTAKGDGYQGINNGVEAEPGAGRWPANVVLSEEAAVELDAQSGDLHSQDPATRRSGSKAQGVTEMGTGQSNEYADRGGASRFFYCAKTSRGERNAGLEDFEEREAGNFEDDDYEWKTDGRGNPRSAPIRKANTHPTVKPINLMRWLVRLVTPPGGLVLDPFAGSGSTGCAAVLEGFDFVGIEREAEYAAIARARIAFWEQHRGREIEDVLALHSASQREAKGHSDRGQGSLLEAAA